MKGRKLRQRLQQLGIAQLRPTIQPTCAKFQCEVSEEGNLKSGGGFQRLLIRESFVSSSIAAMEINCPMFKESTFEISAFTCFVSSSLGSFEGPT